MKIKAIIKLMFTKQYLELSIEDIENEFTHHLLRIIEYFLYLSRVALAKRNHVDKNVTAHKGALLNTTLVINRNNCI